MNRISHLEVICYAIQYVEQKHQEAAEMLHVLGLEKNPWREKLDALCALYRIETGSDFNLDIELD